MKIAKAVPLFKSGEKGLFTNYRVIQTHLIVTSILKKNMLIMMYVGIFFYYHVVHVTAHIWIVSYLENRKQFV